MSMGSNGGEPLTKSTDEVLTGKSDDCQLSYNTVTKLLEVTPVAPLVWRSLATAGRRRFDQWDQCHSTGLPSCFTYARPGDPLAGFLRDLPRALQTFPPGHENGDWKIKEAPLIPPDIKTESTPNIGLITSAVSTTFICEDVQASSEKSDEKTMPSASNVDDVKDPSVDTRS